MANVRVIRGFTVSVYYKIGPISLLPLFWRPEPLNLSCVQFIARNNSSDK